MQKIRANQAALIQGAFCLIALVSFAASLFHIFRHTHHYQWDLKVYFRAPVDYAMGIDPYKVSSFVYPPLFLSVFGLISRFLSYGRFFALVLWAKTVCFAALLWLWKKTFLQNVPIGFFLLFAWFGFNATVLLDFQAGNISVFEATLLFLAFAAFLRKNTALFVSFVLIAASFKLAPISFLILLLLDTPRRTKAFFVGCAAYVAFGLVNFFLFPELTRAFLEEALVRISESGVICPSSLAFFGDAVNAFGQALGLGSLSFVSKILYFIFAGWILFVSGKSWLTWGAGRPMRADGRAFLVLFTILTFVLVTPRMKDYAYILAIPSVLFAVQNFKISVPKWLFFLPLVLIPKGAAWPQPFEIVFIEFWGYGPLLLALFFWVIYLKELRSISVEGP